MEKYIHSYLKYLSSEKNLTENSIVSYTRDLDDFTDFLKRRLAKDAVDPREISKIMVRGYMTALQQAGKSKKTVARRLAALRSFFKYLCREKVVEVNVATNLVTPKLDRRLPSFLDLTETFGVMDLPSEKSFSGVRDRAVLELFYSTGMRLSELVGLDLGSLNRHDHAVRVLGKGRKERIIPFGSKAAETLHGYLQARSALLHKKGPGARTDDEALFLNMHGRRITGRAIQYMVKKYLSRVSEKNKLSPHMLRHTFATHLLDKGADLRAVKELLGHESLSTTQIYTHVTTEKLKKIYDQAHPRA